MILYEKILQIYPELSAYDFAFGDIRLENHGDGKGDFIAKWEHPTLAKPTAEQLA
jgi:hypothetical protein